MFNYYDVDIIPILLNRFKVDDVVICGELDKQTLNQISNHNYNIRYVSKGFPNLVDNNDYSLRALSKLTNYGAIFINDDPNWYTVFNELKIINKTNDEFPLVFICNNILSNKRRDSYFNPKIIPEEFRNKYSNEFSYNGINFRDEFYHALDENTPNNGVMTAIEDFLFENTSVGILDIKLINGTTILYPKNNISQIRLGVLSEEIVDHALEQDTLLDKLFETQVFRDYLDHINMSPNGEDLSKYPIILAEKEEIIKDYENKIRLHDDEMDYKNSQIVGFNSKLNLRDAQIKNIESKLFNRDNEISSLSDKLQIANNQIVSLKKEIGEKDDDYKKQISKANNQIVSLKKEIGEKDDDYKKQISKADSVIDSLNSKIAQKEQIESQLNDELKIANGKIKDNSVLLDNNEQTIFKNEILIDTSQKELDDMRLSLNSIKQKFTNQQSKIENNEYCIKCYREEIKNSHLEIQYLKKDSITRKFFSPLAYLLLIIKSKPNELGLNLKLYKSLKNSKCFDIGFYLSNYEDLLQSKWCKYFSPELHYICNGFGEERKFNKKYFNRNSKEELLDYILKCQ